jgi:C-terminal processing protease CtpA/Prc
VTVEEMTRLARLTMGGVARVDRLAGNVAHLELGPILLPPSLAGDAVCAALRLVAGAEVLILDLRGTVGGDPTMVALVCSHLVDDVVELTGVYRRDTDRVEQSWTVPYLPGDRFGGGSRPVSVLTGPDTFSGGEALAYDLQQLGRATVFGEPTRGGAHPREGFRLHPHLELTVPTGRAVHPVTGTNWEGRGVAPDVALPAAAALPAAHRRALEHVVAHATGPAGEQARTALAALTDEVPADDLETVGA